MRRSRGSRSGGPTGWLQWLAGSPAAVLRRWRRRVLHGRAASIPVVSQVVRNDLDRANAVLERIFLNLSRHFEPMTERVQGLVQSSQALHELASGREQGQTLFQRAITVLHEPLQFIDRCVSQHTRLLELLNRCEEEMRLMLRFQMQMSDLLAPLSFVEVLFRVESASLDLEHRETFGTVAADINRLRQLVDEAFQKNAGLLSSTHTTLAAVRRKLEHDFRQHARAITEKRQKIEAALEKLDTQLLRNSRQETDAHALTRKLTSDVSSIVSALQFQDIITQKCSHVVQALGEWEQHHIYDRAFVTLQVAQLETVDRDIDAAVAEISAGIGRIRELGEGIDRQCVSMDDFEGMIASADGMVQMLLDSIRDTRGILSGTTALIAEASEAARPAGSIAANLTSTLGELSINMRLVALNAQVRSVQTTGMTGLEVLAVRTAEISNKITGVSRDVSARLACLREVTDEMFGLFDQFRREGHEHEQHMDARQGAVETELHRLRDETLGVFQTITQAVEHVRTAADGLQQNLSDVPSAHGAVCKAIEDLRSFSRDYCTEDDDLSQHAAELMEAQAGTYTMASERQVHAAVAKGASGVPAVTRDEPTTPELFDAATDQAAPPPAHARAPLTSTRRATVSAAPATPSPSTARHGFGDNVDLF